MKALSEILLKSTDSIQVAIEVLHAGGCRIALVIDGSGKLLGTVTDGDIRRALIKHVNMDFYVEKIMNTTPTTALRSENSEAIISKMMNRNLLHVPIIDEQGVLVGLETLQHLIEKPSYDNLVLLMAGGFGARLHPLTENIPKTLLKVGNKPVLETIVLQFIDSGFNNFYISTHYKSEMIRDYFGNGNTNGITINYLSEKVPLGTAGSLGLLPKNIPDLPIIVMNGDLLTKVDFKNLLDFHNTNGGLATMCVREYDFQVPYGVVNVDDSKVTNITEKPVHKFFVNAGIYVLDKKLINKVDGNSYLDMTDLLENELEAGDINAFPIYEYWLDIGRTEEYERANREIQDL